jgi:hypothetical protein
MTETGELQAPPPPPPPSKAPGNPWERRSELGFAEGFTQALKLLITAPTDFFGRTIKKGDFGSPLIFAILVGWIGIAIGQLWEVLVGASMLSMLPAEAREYVAFLPGSAASFTFSVIFAPIYIIIALFIWSAILHLCLVIVGGLEKSTAGFEGTFRVVSYATVAQLANLIPIVGGLISLVWSLVLAILGLQKLHETPQGKAVIAVLIPAILCCVCVGLMIGVVGAGLIATFANQ